ncbi:MAG: helix-turn-helix transcriptional regulator [Eggerthellaceae bacterium]|jgi:transcriptional regulator with XRE-family HTH domain
MANDTARYPLITKPASSLAQTLATNVTALRSQQGLSKQMFALMAGISRPMLNRIESGEADTRLSYVQRIADALGVEPTYLLTPHDAE